MEFADFLKDLREKNKLSIRQLALYSDVSAGYLSQIENGIRGIPSPDVLKKLYKPLKISYEELLIAAGYLEEEQSNGNDLDDELEDPEISIFFKDYLSSPKEKQEELRKIWEIIKEREAGRKPGDPQR